MDETPYKAPGEQTGEHPSVASESRSFSATFGALACSGMAAFFLFVFVILIADFTRSLRKPKDWSEAAVAIWGLLNSAMWGATAAVTWTNRERLREAILIADLLMLLSIFVLMSVFK